jgi:hypothetical protein
MDQRYVFQRLSIWLKNPKNGKLRADYQAIIWLFLEKWTFFFNEIGFIFIDCRKVKNRIAEKDEKMAPLLKISKKKATMKLAKPEPRE